MEDNGSQPPQGAVDLKDNSSGANEGLAANGAFREASRAGVVRNEDSELLG